MDRAEIYCICFNLTSTFLACSSDKGTVHVYSLSGPTQSSSSAAPVSSKSYEENNLPPTPHTSETYEPSSRQSMSQNNRDNNNNSNSSADVSASSAPSTGNKQMAGMGISLLKGILPVSMVPKYFDSEWSFAQVRGIEGKAICAFSKDSSRIFVGTDLKNLRVCMYLCMYCMYL